MPTDRDPVIRTVLKELYEHLLNLPEGEWTRAQNGARQQFSANGVTFDVKFRTDEARSRELAAITASTTKVITGKTKTTAQREEELAARVAAANAEHQRTSGVPLGTPPSKGFSAPEVIHEQNAETREAL